MNAGRYVEQEQKGLGSTAFHSWYEVCITAVASTQPDLFCSKLAPDGKLRLIARISQRCLNCYSCLSAYSQNSWIALLGPCHSPRRHSQPVNDELMEWDRRNGVVHLLYRQEFAAWPASHWPQKSRLQHLHCNLCK